ncbi:MAG: hypothetical protein FD165_2222 [Gammaproteobacteria bacterium]|nr:MAG: hypothetical protein FD165_2222 [Gammaproteobacteria bacterium]TND03254.1 MAG: hypothetical protein FD120_1927 [Gammaproteobacteria bacterium]
MSRISAETEVVRTKIWLETPQLDDPFSASKCYCYGYDVYGDLLHKASWTEYVFLMFSGEAPSPAQILLLDSLAVAIANPGIRDHSVRAAMNGGVGGSPNAACLIAALSVGAGGLGGAHEVAAAMELWTRCGADLNEWKKRIQTPHDRQPIDTWPPIEHVPGFNPHGVSCPKPLLETLHHLANCSPGEALPWLETNRANLEQITKCPLAMPGIAAAAFADLGFSSAQAEMLYLIMRLPGAAVHALEQQRLGWRKYPFFKNGLHLENDPGPFRINQDSL